MNAAGDNVCIYASLERINLQTELAGNMQRQLGTPLSTLASVIRLYGTEYVSDLQLDQICSEPDGFRYSYIVPLPKSNDCFSKSLTCNDFRGIAISPIH